MLLSWICAFCCHFALAWASTRISVVSESEANNPVERYPGGTVASWRRVLLPRNIENQVDAAQSLLQGNQKSVGDELNAVLKACRIGRVEELFFLIDGKKYEELSHYCALNYSSYAWYYIVSRLGNLDLASKIIEVLSAHPLLMVDRRPLFYSHSTETTLFAEAHRVGNQVVVNFIKSHFSP